MTQTAIDQITPYAPALAARGQHAIGVRTTVIRFEDQPDITRTQARGASRELPLEIWYPAAADTPQGGSYDTLIRCGTRRATLRGQARRDAPALPDARAPLIVISHGYPGNRYLMVHLAEALASHGYVVAACDHTGSTYDDADAFGITLLHRPLDQLGVLDAMAAMGGDIGALVDCTRTGLVGYSMGGYGALITAGAGLASEAVAFERAPPARMLARHVAGTDSHAALHDARIKAIIPIGPWGNSYGMWAADGLAGLRVPMLLMAGTADDVSGYVAMRGLFDGAVSVDRHLLSFAHAGHNAAAPYPAPPCSYAVSERLGWAPFQHYADPVWDTVRMNNIAQHYATAFFGLHLRKDAVMQDYLTPAFHGFAAGTATGLNFESLHGSTTP
ncbi:alpha/beta fold hydrolase [Sulfitobacter sp. HNIBRBA2951]|uniref:alpha/beta hydrolase family protein n=1 Tax=Sulfitobacter aquimarinus TaxID=3158557 RepID=UPI0032DFB04A